VRDGSELLVALRGGKRALVEVCVETLRQIHCDSGARSGVGGGLTVTCAIVLTVGRRVLAPFKIYGT
jgi:hypothetical protein